MTNHEAPYVGMAYVPRDAHSKKENEQQGVQDEDHDADSFTGIGMFPVRKHRKQSRNSTGACTTHVR